MGLSDDLREGAGPLWEQVVTHAFVIELGDNTLSADRFRVYFDQDHLFLKDWAQRLASAGKRPANHYYQTWIDLHTSDGMTGFVSWMRQTVDDALLRPMDRPRLQTIFRDVLRYELQFWEMAYWGEEWPA